MRWASRPTTLNTRGQFHSSPLHLYNGSQGSLLGRESPSLYIVPGGGRKSDSLQMIVNIHLLWPLTWPGVKCKNRVRWHEHEFKLSSGFHECVYKINTIFLFIYNGFLFLRQMKRPTAVCFCFSGLLKVIDGDITNSSVNELYELTRISSDFKLAKGFQT